MGPRLLCFAGGAALTAFFVHLGLLTTPFFGSGAFLWANIFASFLLALALGYGLGDLLSRLAGPMNLKLAAPRLAVAGGLGAWLAAYMSPVVCRRILAHDPDWTLAPMVAIVAISVVPGALIAAIVPSELRVRLPDSDPETMARAALRLLGLMVLGGVAGIAMTAKPLLRADEVDVFMHAYATGALLMILGLAFMGPAGRGVSVALLVGAIGLSAWKPSEIQDEQFAVALETAWKEGQGAGIYYHRTATKHLLTDEQLRKHHERVARQAGAEKAGVILTCEMLLALGEVTVSGDGLRRTLNLLLKADAKPFIMPIFDQIRSVRSDGRGMLHFTIKRSRGKQGAYFNLPGKEPGSKIKFWFKDDFTIHIIKKAHIWKLEFGPLTTVHAGIFEVNDTKHTPLRVLDVKFWVDASLLGIILEDYPEQVAVKCVAQGSIGGVTTRDVINIKKDIKR